MFKKHILQTIIVVLLVNVTLKSQTKIVLRDDSIKRGETLNLTKNNEYILEGFVFVEEDATLNIEAGTVIKAKQGVAENASALVISRGGKIFANGTKEEPIIFTSELDDTNIYDDLPLYLSGLWGGVIVLGNATINTPGGVEQIEGIPSNELRGAYGGNNDDDNSGVLRYVSIRHGGTNIGANNEINGLTLGAVGRGTKVEFIEIYANSDDGIEFFGGTVNTKNIAIAFCEDDSFDWDEGYRGNNQFWFSIQSPSTGNNIGENDGATDPEDSKPYAIPYIYNGTFIGSGLQSNRTESRGFHIRDNSGGFYKNSIITDLGGAGLEIEDLSDPIAEDSKKRFESSEIQITNNLWFNIGDNTYNTVSPDVKGSKPYSQDFVREYLRLNNNVISNPMLAGISRINDGGLDPRPNPGIAWELDKAELPVNNNFFEQTNYIGAFGDDNWLDGWTFLSKGGFLGNLKTTSVGELGKQVENELYLYPNPVIDDLTISYNLINSGELEIEVYNSFGLLLYKLESNYFNSGIINKTYSLNQLTPGIYFVKLKTESNETTKKIIVK